MHMDRSHGVCVENKLFTCDERFLKKIVLVQEDFLSLFFCRLFLVQIATCFQHKLWIPDAYEIYYSY